MAKKTIILKVSADPGDYGALIFEDDSETTVAEFAEEIRDSGQKSFTREFKIDPEFDLEITGELLEFDADIPEDTWKAIKLKLLGTDNVKHCDYHWVEVREEISPKPKLTKCTECGGTSLTESREDYEYLQGIGIPVILKNIPKWTCLTCGEVFTGIPNSDALDKDLAWYFINLPYRLGGSEFYFLRRISAISREKLVDTINEAVYTSILKWERGTEVVPWETDRKLRELTAKEFKLEAPSKDLGKDCDDYRILTIKARLEDRDWHLTVASGIKS